jgi:hypothetical protein
MPKLNLDVTGTAEPAQAAPPPPAPTAAAPAQGQSTIIKKPHAAAN